MKKYLLVPMIGIALSTYFVLTLFVLPEKFLSKEQFEPSPYFEAKLSDSEILLGDSFFLEINSKNRGDYGDIHIVSTAFPTLDSVDDTVQIVTYDFSNSPIFIEKGDEIGSEYSGGAKKVYSQYPSIEAMNRPVPKGSEYSIKLQVTPQNTGPFLIYVKTKDIPHTSEKSHFPQRGLLDHQNEYVSVFTVNVDP